MYCAAHAEDEELRERAAIRPRIELTDELVNHIIDEVSHGQNLTRAAYASGITPRTLYDWLARGARGEEPYVGLLQQVVQAESLLVRRALILFWRNARPRDILDFLGRRFPREWAPEHVVRVEDMKRRLDETVGRDWMWQWAKARGLIECDDDG